MIVTKPKPKPVIDIDEYIKKLVDNAPPLTDHQIARLRPLLAPKDKDEH